MHAATTWYPKSFNLHVWHIREFKVCYQIGLLNTLDGLSSGFSISLSSIFFLKTKLSALLEEVSDATTNAPGWSVVLFAQWDAMQECGQKGQLQEKSLI